MRTATLALVALVILVSAPRPSPAQDAQTASLRAAAEALPVGADVDDDKGQPIRDLIASDFAVRIDGRPRRVVSAQWIATGTAAPAAATAPKLPDGFVSNESSAGGGLIVLIVDHA